MKCVPWLKRLKQKGPCLEGITRDTNQKAARRSRGEKHVGLEPTLGKSGSGGGRQRAGVGPRRNNEVREKVAWNRKGIGGRGRTGDMQRGQVSARTKTPHRVVPGPRDQAEAQ